MLKARAATSNVTMFGFSLETKGKTVSAQAQFPKCSRLVQWVQAFLEKT
jgi:hypothetical protein